MPQFSQALTQATANLGRHDPVMADLIKTYGSCTLQPHRNYFSALAGSIVGQQLSVKAAAAIRQRLADLAKVGDFPSPEEVAEYTPETLRAVGLSRAKVVYMYDLATHVLDGRINLTRLPQQTNEAIITEVTAVKGIGEWTAQMFLIFCLGRLDVLPTGDLGVRKGMQALYNLSALPSPVTMMVVAERHGWSGYETVASWYIWRSLDNAPKTD